MDPPANRDELIQSFCALTQATPVEAASALSSCDWNIEDAVQSWFTSQDDDDDDDYDDDEPDALEETQPIASTASAAAGGNTRGQAPAAAAASASASSRSKGKGQQGGIRTLRDIGSSAQDADDDDEKDQDYFAGGEKSGLAVQGGGGSGNAQDPIQGILERARRNIARPGNDDEPTRPSYFAGRGVTLGGDDEPSRVIQEPTSRAGSSRPTGRVSRVLHLWQDGFSVDDGDLYRYDDPRNRETLAMIQQGRAPIHLLNVENGQEVDLALDVQKDTKYVKPKTTYKPFSGSGHRLGSPTPGVETPTASISTQPVAVSSTAASSSGVPAQVTVDDTVPTINLQIRLGDGTRLQSRFNTTHTIGDVYDFVDHANPASTERPYALMTTFPNKELDDKGAVLGDLSEFKRGGVVVQKWK